MLLANVSVGFFQLSDCNDRLSKEAENHNKMKKNYAELMTVSRTENSTPCFHRTIHVKGGKASQNIFTADEKLVVWQNAEHVVTQRQGF